MKIIRPADATAVLKMTGHAMPLAQRVLFELLVDFDVQFTIAYPGKVEPIPARTFCLLDDGSGTRQMMGLPDDGPDGFDRPTLDALLMSANLIVISGCEQHPSVNATLAWRIAETEGRGILIDTEPRNFLAWVERVRQLRYGGPDVGWGKDIAISFIAPEGIDASALPPAIKLGRLKPASEGLLGPGGYDVVVEAAGHD